MNLPQFKTRKELFDFLVTNKETLIEQKKANIKMADAIVLNPVIIPIAESKLFASKADIIRPEPITGDVFVQVVINSTNVVDSHKDMHYPGLWTKSIRENKENFHIQEHEMSFGNIISSGKDLIVYTKTVPWGDLGFLMAGNTEALIFESLIRSNRNAYMADQYRKGYVTNHSVGMRYVKLIMCVNDEDYGAEYEAWEKYYPEVANKDVADESGYFWVVKEAKVIEGSAVVRGSNMFTPTMQVTESKNEPEQSTHEQESKPVQTTQRKAIDYTYLTKNFKLN